MHLIKKIQIIAVFCFLFLPAFGQINNFTDSLSHSRKIDSLMTIQKSRTKAGELIFLTNMGVWSFDRFAIQGDYAHISFNSIKKNIKTGFVWDNDMFATNLFFHPYHGGIYFNAARSNGMSFWQSVPFAAGGSLMWEFCMENEPAAINDFAATTIGGTCLGEMNFRISDLLIDDRTVGFDRFKREALLTIISPARGLNRILSGDAWKHRNVRGNSILSSPITFYSTVGHRIITDKSDSKHDVSNMLCFDLGLTYGDPFSEENEKPYDFFKLKAGGNVFSQQPLIGNVNALGMICAKTINLPKQNRQLTLGIFQHFNFYQSQAEINSVSLNPYKISEAASAGPALLYQVKHGKRFAFNTTAYLSGILLGGSQTDHFKYEKRDYNMGSGFSTKLNFELQLGHKIRFIINSEDYRIYSWIGYKPDDSRNIDSNVQGDVGNASLSVLRFNFNYIINRHFLLTTETSTYYRRSVYKYYSNVEHTTAENKLSVGYIF